MKTWALQSATPVITNIRSSSVITFILLLTHPFPMFYHVLILCFYYATIAYHVGLNADLGLPHPGPTS